ncbi:MAG TPA: hypothetical protein V6D47_19025, partial [Oscillatoriaceae cyanobacterium]
EYVEESRAFYRGLTETLPALLGGGSFEDYLARAEAFMIEARMVGNARQMAQFLEPLVADIGCDVFPDEDHFSVVPAALARGLAFALKRP